MARKPEQRNALCPPQMPASPTVDQDADPRMARVGSQLRGIYDDVLAERVPDIFEDLLRKLS